MGNPDFCLFFNSVAIEHDGERYYLKHWDGEAMEVSLEDIERMITTYMRDNF